MPMSRIDGLTADGKIQMPDAVQRIARAMLKDFEKIMSEVTSRVWRQVPAYADVLLQQDELGERVRENILVVITCLQENRPPSASELARSRENGERRALQGVSQAAIIQSFRNAERTLSESFTTWSTRMQVRPADARIGNQELIGHLDALERAMLESFVAMQRQISTHNVLTEPDLMNRLVSGQAIASVELEYLAGALHLRDISATNFVGVCAVLTGEADERQLIRVRHHVVSHLHRATGQPVLSGTVLTDRGLHAAIFTLPWNDDIKGLADITTAAVSEKGFGVPTLIGVGDSRLGLSSVGSSCRQAISALEIGRARKESGITVVYSDVLLEVLTLRDPEVTRQLHERYIGALVAYDFLEETLRCFLETNQSIAETAQRLRVHKNTVVYRIRRVQELTGLDLHSVRDVTRAVLAIEGAKLGAVDAPVSLNEMS